MGFHIAYAALLGGQKRYQPGQRDVLVKIRRTSGVIGVLGPIKRKDVE